MRQDQSRLKLTVEGRDIPWVFANRKGGKMDSQESKSYQGNQLPEKANGGPKTRENVTFQGEFIPAIHSSLLEWLEEQCGEGKALLTETFVGNDKRRVGKVKTYRGFLKSVDAGEYDASSADPRLAEFEISTHGV